ncbi:hypothetical protein F4808DRAFT_401804 [Astrocystis sublimbata]|nr:hypothetical protein F4808DRAFT_401794 [Astrocystis sublimbata]KAI0190581.1 hypothetical protein F4808DRAFT_401804 [Astrocystis sublimbata]
MPRTTQHAIDSDHPEFQNDSRWPRRLLHVRSMTSYPWRPGNMYGHSRDPPYVAISYTWGRYALWDVLEKPHVKPLPIRGVPWTIPRIDPDAHFHVEQFRHIIRQATGIVDKHYEFDNYRALRQTPANWLLRPILRFLERHQTSFEYIWLDVACIEQRDSPVQAAEIGRQARIFQYAEHCYVWLSHTPHQKLEKLLEDLAKANQELHNEPYELTRPYDERDWVALAIRTLEDLTADPWFKSLWTLQEGYLCTHATVLSREGRVCADGTQIVFKNASLNFIFGLCNRIMDWTERTRVPRDNTNLCRLIQIIRDTGVSALWYNNPMGLLAVSTKRKPTREEDRFYGIMQVMGPDFRVGKAANPHSNQLYTLESLDEEFGEAVLRTYPILSQMFIHTTPPISGRGWRVHEDSVVPRIVERGDLFGWNSNRLDVNININAHPLCCITTQKISGQLWAHLNGKACAFDTLHRGWSLANESPYIDKLSQSHWRMHMSTTASVQMIALDRGSYIEPLPPHLAHINLLSSLDQRLQDELASWILMKSQNTPLVVFLLGSSDIGKESFNTGLLLYESTDPGVKHWCRVGICIWIHSQLESHTDAQSLWNLLKGNDENWFQMEGIFG